MRGKDVRLDNVSITYPDGFTAVQPTDLTVQAGEFFSILGPSGCGKTTILRAISGFLEPSDGRILIGGEDQRGKGPNTRPTAMIFQNLALFPLMPVWENVAFGLEARGVGRRARRAKAEELLSHVALLDQADKKPGELSGGQRQRVAIARALAVEPAVLLLDEPLAALDLKLRQHMRAELREIQKKTEVTFFYITHDQGEALTMSDRIAVMNDGVVQQVGTGDEIYSQPKTSFVASFVGETNVFEGRVIEADATQATLDTPFGRLRGTNPQGLSVGSEARLFVRPEAVTLGAEENQITARLARSDLEGAYMNLFFAALGTEIAVHVTNSGGRPQIEGETVLSFSPDRAVVLPDGPLARTGRELAAQ